MNKKTENREPITIDEIETYLKLLAPFAPFMTEELWQSIGDKRLKTKDESFRSIHLEAWPKWDEKMLETSQVELVVQVNGKVRETVTVDKGLDQAEAEKAARESQKVRKYVEAGEIRKVIYVKDRLINFVVKLEG